jgi:hypothetical protein
MIEKVQQILSKWFGNSYRILLQLRWNQQREIFGRSQSQDSLPWSVKVEMNLNWAIASSRVSLSKHTNFSSSRTNAFLTERSPWVRLNPSLKNWGDWTIKNGTASNLMILYQIRPVFHKMTLWAAKCMRLQSKTLTPKVVQHRLLEETQRWRVESLRIRIQMPFLPTHRALARE